MRAIYLIARREYLSYVATVGFWISMASVPFFMILGGAIPFLVESSTPTRHYVILDETGRGLDDVIEADLAEERREAVRAALEAAARMQGEDRAEAALRAFDSDPDGLEGLDPALAELGLEQGGSAFAAGLGRRIRVEAPAADPEGLRPYLTGDRRVETAEGPRPLFAALVVRPGADGRPAIDYYSTNLTDPGLLNDARRALESHLRAEYLEGRGIASDELERLRALSVETRELDPAAEAEEATEVTIADRAPFIIAVVLAFVLWSAVFSVGNMLLTSLIEEKGGKIIEVLLATARFQDLLIGKLVGVALVSMTLFAVWGGIGAAFSAAAGSALNEVDPDLAPLLASVFDPALLLPAFGYFVVGYLMFGAIFLAIGSLCDTLQDAQTLMGPLVLVLMAPLIILVFAIQSPDSTVLQVGSWVPVWTPFIMLARLPSEPPLWELVGTTALMVATMIAVLWAAAAVFRQGALNQADAESVKRVFKLKRS